jgi:hypothetical protein
MQNKMSNTNPPNAIKGILKNKHSNSNSICSNPKKEKQSTTSLLSTNKSTSYNKGYLFRINFIIIYIFISFMKKSFTSSIDLSQKSTSDLKKKFGTGTPKYTFNKDIKVKESFVDYLDKSKPSKSRELRNTPGPGKYEPNNVNLNRNHAQWT